MKCIATCMSKWASGRAAVSRSSDEFETRDSEANNLACWNAPQ